MKQRVIFFDPDLIDKIPGLVATGVGALLGLAKSDGHPILVYSI